MYSRGGIIPCVDVAVSFYMYIFFSNVLIDSGAPARAKRARSGAPSVRKFGKLSIPENLVMT